MKHLFTLKSLLLTLVMLCGLNAWGEAVVLTTANYTWTAENNQVTQTIDPVTFDFKGGTTKPTYYDDGLRTYEKCVITISSKYTISKVAFSYTINNSGCLKDVSTGTWNNSTKTWSGEANSVSLTVGHSKGKSNGQVRITEIVVTCDIPADVLVAPVITETSEPAKDGKYYLNTNATAEIDCKTVGATIKYAITGDDVTDANKIVSWTEGSKVPEVSKVSFTYSEPATRVLWAKAVKGDNVSDVVKKEFTFIKKPIFAIFEQVTSESQIVEGAKYVITNEADDKAMLGWETGNNCKPESVTISNGFLELPYDFTGIITLGKTETGYTLKQLDGFYLTATSTTNNYLVAKSAPEYNSYWTITIGNNNVASIENVNNKSRGVMQYNSSSSLFACYSGTSQNSLHLYRMVEGTETGLDAVLVGDAGKKYQINTTLRVNYTDVNYAYASTFGGGSKATTPTEAQKKEWWSDKVDKFNQNDWVAIDIQGFDVVEGAEIEAGRVATLVSNSEFPVIKFDSMKTADGTAIAANTYRVANFNIGDESPLVNKLWLVEPQPAEYCKVKAYVDKVDVKTNSLVAKTGSEATEIEGTSYEPLKMTVNLDAANEKITEPGWYVFEGIVVNGTDGLELNAISATVGSIETGVEGVETSSVKVYGAEGVINVESEEVAPIAVYSANGAIVSSVEASSASIAVAPGFYIVKAGNSVSKVTVK